MVKHMYETLTTHISEPAGNPSTNNCTNLFLCGMKKMAKTFNSVFVRVYQLSPEWMGKTAFLRQSPVPV